MADTSRAHYTLAQPLRVVWCGNHSATRHPDGCTHRGAEHPLGEPVRIHHRDNPDHGYGYQMWEPVGTGGSQGQLACPDADSMVILWVMLVGMYDLPHRKVSAAFAVVAEWREVHLRGYRVFIPGRYDKMQFHNE